MFQSSVNLVTWTAMRLVSCKNRDKIAYIREFSSFLASAIQASSTATDLSSVRPEKSGQLLNYLSVSAGVCSFRGRWHFLLRRPSQGSPQLPPHRPATTTASRCCSTRHRRALLPYPDSRRPKPCLCVRGHLRRRSGSPHRCPGTRVPPSRTPR